VARSYKAEGRAEQALRTRARILAAAAELLLDGGGYAGMTISALARRADVSAQTVYNSVGGKADIIKAVYDLALAGDEDPTPMSARPAFRRVSGASNVDEWAGAYAAWVTTIWARVGPLLGVLLAHGPAGDPVLEEFLVTIDGERRRGNLNSLEGLLVQRVVRRGKALDACVDAVWTLTSPEVYDRLVGRRGWTTAAYERWLAAQLRTAVG